jgi:3-phenylpropionate/trans-cinnamate dioxygenase ferredoxin reductase subunit
MGQDGIVIVGAGHSGAKAASALRKHGWTGGITLVGQEAVVPYDRPPLSKGVLLGKKTGEQCSFHPDSWYAEQGIALRLGEPVRRIDRAHQRVVFDDGRELGYSRLLIATGSRLRHLTVPGAELPGVWPLRTRAQAEAISQALHRARRLVVIGAGVIGLEVAAAAVELGCKVHVIEAAPVAMGRSLPAVVSTDVVAEHRSRGVELRFGEKVLALEGDERVRGVRLATGEVLSSDLVVHGIGVLPCSELAEAAGLAVDDGIRANSYLQTADERIYACGDVCRFDSTRHGGTLRLENWRNAEDQADTVARNMLGERLAFDPVPWFWSNQYDFTLQVAGLPATAAHTEVQAVGDSRMYLSFDEAGTLLGVAGLGAVRDIAGPLKKHKEGLAAA